MDRRTSKGQRKIRISSKLLKRQKKVSVVKAPEPSCEDPTCGCGN